MVLYWVVVGDGRRPGDDEDVSRTLVNASRATFHGLRPEPEDAAPLPPPPQIPALGSVTTPAIVDDEFEPTRVSDGLRVGPSPMPLPMSADARDEPEIEPTRVPDGMPLDPTKIVGPQGKLLETRPPPAPPLIPGPDGEETRPPQEATGRASIAGRYTVERALGEGAMGKVYEVRHQQLGKSFALKFIQAGLIANPKVRDKFFQEARLASSLDHPNIVSIVDFGEDPTIGTFMVMELLDGEPLSSRLGGKPLQLKPALDVVFQVAEALHYIHERGIVHCDIKSDNILLCRVPTSTERRKWQVKLLDFGIARVQVDNARRTGSLEGTPGYIAPERLEGLAPQPSMDIYSLGVLAYELITGSLPFVGNIAQVLMAHRDTPPPPFSVHLRDGVDESVEALVMRAMAKKPEERQRDMSAFLYELKTVMNMLGFTGRARRRVRDGRAVQKKDRAAAAVQFGYQATPVPMAAIDADGTVICANRAFALFLTGKPDAAVAGADLYGGPLARIYPDVARDVRKVHVSGQTKHRILEMPGKDGEPIRLAAWLVRGTEDAGEVHLTIHGDVGEI